MLGDNITIKDMELDELLRKARRGNLPPCPGGPRRELIGQRAYRLELAQTIVDAAVGEGRSLTAGERNSVDCLMAEAEKIGPAIRELWEAERRELIEDLAAR